MEWAIISKRLLDLFSNSPKRQEVKPDDYKSRLPTLCYPDTTFLLRLWEEGLWKSGPTPLNNLSLTPGQKATVSRALGKLALAKKKSSQDGSGRIPTIFEVQNMSDEELGTFEGMGPASVAIIRALFGESPQ